MNVENSQRDYTFLAILLLATISFSWRLTTYGLWEDEGYTYFLAHMPFAETLRAASTYYLSPPLWYILNKPLLWMSANAFWSVRLLSLAASLTSLLVIYRLVRRWSDPTTAQIAALLMAFSPMAMSYAQSGRDYAFIALVYLTAVYFIERWVSQCRWYGLLIVGALELALLYLHSYGPILYITFNLYFLMLYARQVDLRRPWLICQLVVLAFFAPRLLTLLQQLHQVQNNDFLIAIWQQTHGLKALWYSIRNFIPGASINAFPPIVTYWTRSWFCLLPFLLLLTGFRWNFKKGEMFKGESWRFLLLWLLPLLLILLYSYLLSPVYVVGRTEAIVLPMFCGWLALLIRRIPWRIPWRGVRLALLAFIVAVGSHLFWSLHYDPAYANFRRTHDRQTAAAIQASEAQAVILVNDVSAGVMAHLLSSGFKLPLAIFPNLIAPASDAMSWQQWPYQALELKSRREFTAAELDQALAKVDQLLQQYSVDQLTLVYVFSEHDGMKVIQRPYAVSLMQHLDKLGFHPLPPVMNFPMDHMSGSHGVVHLAKTPNRPANGL